VVAAFPFMRLGVQISRLGGFAARDWANTNVILEAPNGVARRALFRWAVLNKFRWFDGRGLGLLQQYYTFLVPEDLPSNTTEATLHVWAVRGRPRGFSLKDPRCKKNFVYLTLKVPMPAAPTASPSEQFITGIGPPNRRDLPEITGRRAWLVERNEGPEAALRIIDVHPLEIQHQLARAKLRLLKKLGRQDEIDAFLKLHIPWLREHDKYHERNVRGLVERLGRPGVSYDP